MITQLQLTDGRRVVLSSEKLIRGLVRTTYMRTGLSRPSENKAKDYNPSDPANQWIDGVPYWQQPNLKARWIRGLPDTVQINGRTDAENQPVILTPRHQDYWYRHNVARVPGFTTQEYHDWFESMTSDDRVITNFFGSRTCAVYPTGKNLDKEPMKFFTLVTGLTEVELLDTIPSNVYGKQQLPVRCIDASKDFEHITPETHPLQFCELMNSVRTPILTTKGKWINGRPEYLEYGYSRFHQFAYRSITPMFMPNTDVGWIEASLVQVIEPGYPAPTFNMMV